MKLLLLLTYFSMFLLTRAKTEEVSTPASLLGPRNVNYHAFDAEKFLKSLNLPIPTKQGPVLFPNDAPPPPRTPLIVTSRPLIESIARSELNPLPANSSVAESRVAFIPYLARVKNYKPFGYSYGSDGSSLKSVVGSEIYDHQGQTSLPPIYKALSNHAKQNVAEIQQKPKHYDYQVKEPDYTYHHSNEIHDDRNSEYDHNQNYAFSYAVKDNKTGDDFSHSQHSSGSATNGEYRVRLPDGRMQIVSYTADENGYNADVRYDDEDKISENTISNDYKANNNDYNAVNNDYNNVHHSHNKNDNYIENLNSNSANIKNNNDYNDIHKDYNANNIKYNDNRNSYIDSSNMHNAYDVNNNDYSNNLNNNAEQRDFKPNNKEIGKDDYYNQYSDSKEYYNEDYSSEYNGNYQPYKSKYSTFAGKNNFNNIQVLSSTVKPYYEQLKDLFATKSLYNTQQNYDKTFNLNDASPKNFPTFDVTTENNVVNNLYANLRSIVPADVTPFPLSASTPFAATTPSSYLVSTIANLRNRIYSNQPVLSDRFIDKINKYLTFK